MGFTAIFTCLECKNEFTARSGGGRFSDLYRCVACDAIVSVPRYRIHGDGMFEPVERADISPNKRCEKCNGELRDDLGPMCPKCKSRNIEVKRTICRHD